jgi:uncharacterized protein (TIGR00255 family)
MISSMTGFGRGETHVDGHTATVELKSVNSRFCEVTIRLPRVVAERENDIQRLVKTSFARGRINVQIQLEAMPDAGSASGSRVDQNVAASYKKLLEELRTATGIEEPVGLDHLLKFSDIFTTEDESELTPEDTWAAVTSALSDASDAMQAMREREGVALKSELLDRVGEIETNLIIVQEQAPGRLPKANDRLRSRLAEILEDDRIDNERIEFEMAMLADKLDIREECVRLRSHIDVFREALAGSEPVGRKLNFLSQEMNREINTIGSKANDAGLSQVVVKMKENLEKIREQIENVE